MLLNKTIKIPKLSYSLLRTLMVAGISLIIFANLNGVFTVFLNRTAPFSPLILLLSILVLFISKVRYSDFNTGIRLMIVFMLSFLVFGTISSLFYFQEYNIRVENIQEEYRDILTSLLLIIVMYAYCVQLRDRQKLDQFIFFVGIVFFIAQLGGILEGGLGLSNVFYASTAALVGGERALGFFGNPNETGFQANLTMVLGLYLFLIKKIPLWGVFLFIVSSIAASVYSFSKMSIIISFVNLTFFSLYVFFTYFKLKSKVRFRAFWFLTLSFIAVFAIIVPYFINFYLNLEASQRKRVDELYSIVIEGRIDNETTSSRSSVAIEAIELIAQNPVTGYGLESFSNGSMFTTSHGVHNIYLKVYGESGIAAFIIYITLLLYIVYAAFFKVKVPDSYFLLALLGSFMMLSFASHTALSRKFIMPLFGIMFAIIQYNSKGWLKR